MIRAQLREMKEKSGMTNKELADRSGVSLPTVNRIMAGQTDSPSYQTVCDLVMAMGGSLDEMAGIQRPCAPAAEGNLEMYQKLVAEKDMWLRRLFVICCVLTTVIMGVLIFDWLNPAIGYFRR